MLLALVCFCLYAAAAGVILIRLFDKKGPNNRLSYVLAAIALVLHLWVLKGDIFVAPGQNLSMLNVAALVGWLISLTMLLAAFSMTNTILLPVVFGFTGLLVLLNLFIPDAHIMQVSIRPGLIIHIGLALFAYACLGIALLYALQLSYINMRLKEKKASLLHSSLPPLMMVEGILFKLLTVGTILLTLSLISGFLFLENMFAREQAHKTVFSILAWIVFSVQLLGHFKFGWRGKPIVFATVLGSVLLSLAYFGSRFVKEIILS
ncbi:MAG: ABC-type uncharacterized transport system permease subunit [Paraglaciecola sp.]|jgi:ABC-type uncharacterized transport system permease subunit